MEIYRFEMQTYFAMFLFLISFLVAVNSFQLNSLAFRSRSTSLLMAEITPALVKQLREKSGAGMLDCRNALSASEGNLELAVDWLRKKGLAAVGKYKNSVNYLMQEDFHKFFYSQEGWASNIVGSCSCRYIS